MKNKHYKCPWQKEVVDSRATGVPQASSQTQAMDTTSEA
jgi:hypothetical protein